jgi:hypothetical protein
VVWLIFELLNETYEGNYIPPRILSAKLLQNVTQPTTLIRKTIDVNFMPLLKTTKRGLRVSETMQNALGDWSRLVNTELLGANWMGSKAVDTGRNVVEAVHTRVDFVVLICAS